MLGYVYFMRQGQQAGPVAAPPDPKEDPKQNTSSFQAFKGKGNTLK